MEISVINSSTEHNAITLIESFFLVKICIPGQAFPGCTAGRLTPGSLQLNQIVCLDAAFSHNSPSIPLLKITSVCKDARKNTVTNSGLRKNLHYFKESFEWMSDDATEDRGSETITHSNSIQINVRTRRLLCDLELAERMWAWPWILTSKYLQAPYDVDFNVRKLMCYFLIIREQFSWEVVSLVLMQKQPYSRVNNVRRIHLNEHFASAEYISCHKPPSASLPDCSWWGEVPEVLCQYVVRRIC